MLANNGQKMVENAEKKFRLIDITIDIIFFLKNWKNYFDRSILVISMIVLPIMLINPCVSDTYLQFNDCDNLSHTIGQ